MTIAEMEDLRQLLAEFALDDSTPLTLIAAARRIRVFLEWHIGDAEDGSQ